ncbi:MAG TPA: signal recognition particle protein [Planctomycetota bacterium]|nr:signal recognition particle protein [Planctomycetota bacterium]
MFESISQKLEGVFRALGRKPTLTEKNIREGMREVRTALLEADVNFNVVRDFTRKVTERAVGEAVIRSVSPAQQIVKVVRDELVELMGPVDHAIPFASEPPTVILLAGLQGSGKTTMAGKLARYLAGKGHHPMLVGADVKRPAAIEQIRVLGRQLEVPVFSEEGGNALKISKQSIKEARKAECDVVILDTAGRLHIDEEMMTEVKEIARAVSPHQIYLVCDAMTGQDAVNSAERFNQVLELDGIILTKMDGDARGGAALSVKAVTGKAIKFVGVGEKLDRIEEFHPERMADRILGMGDVVTLVERAQEQVNLEEAKALQEKMAKATFNLEDFLKQLQQVRRMGPLKELMGMIPGVGKQLKGMEVDEADLGQIEAVIRSMTPEERRRPEIIDGSRRMRIAKGSGTEPADVNGLLKQFKQMKGLMKRFGAGAARSPDMMMSAMSGQRFGKQRSHRKRKERKKRKKK